MTEPARLKIARNWRTMTAVIHRDACREVRLIRPAIWVKPYTARILNDTRGHGFELRLCRVCKPPKDAAAKR